MTRLRQIRQQSGLTQREVAAVPPGIDVQRVSSAERSPDPARITLGTALHLARVYGIEPSEILSDEPLNV